MRNTPSPFSPFPPTSNQAAILEVLYGAGGYGDGGYDTPAIAASSAPTTNWVEVNVK